MTARVRRHWAATASRLSCPQIEAPRFAASLEISPPTGKEWASDLAQCSPGQAKLQAVSEGFSTISSTLRIKEENRRIKRKRNRRKKEGQKITSSLSFLNFFELKR
jgi:hypothetical protein